MKQFEKLFKEINEIDYVLITVKSATSRWTPGNRYVYDRVQEVFGKDAAERFIMMCTFADGGIPFATEKLKRYLKFVKVFHLQQLCSLYAFRWQQFHDRNFLENGNEQC